MKESFLQRAARIHQRIREQEYAMSEAGLAYWLPGGWDDGVYFLPLCHDGRVY